MINTFFELHKKISLAVSGKHDPLAVMTTWVNGASPVVQFKDSFTSSTGKYCRMNERNPKAQNIPLDYVVAYS